MAQKKLPAFVKCTGYKLVEVSSTENIPRFRGEIYCAERPDAYNFDLDAIDDADLIKRFLQLTESLWPDHEFEFQVDEIGQLKDVRNPNQPPPNDTEAKTTKKTTKPKS